MRKITDAGTYNVLGGRKTIAFNGKSDQFNAKRSANVSRYIDTNQGSGMEDLYAIMEKYNIKGFEFGNWVTQEERAEYVASLAPTLEDLFSVLGSRNIGINRNVGVAFGARGSRGALAHYEPILNMINLTRRKGAGSLAHEYGHALDYNLGSFLDQHKTYAALSGGRSVSATLPDNTGGQLRAYVNQIIDSIRNGKNFARMDQENKEADARGQNPVYSSYWYRRTEIFARFFEQYVCYYLYERQKSSRLLVKQWQYYMIVPVYVAKDDFMKIKPIADKLMKEMAKFLNSTKGQRVRATAYPKPVITKPDPEAKKIVKPKPTAAPKRKAATKEKGVKSLDEQFASIKKQYPDAILLFRCGDFYEAYKEDAKEVCKILCITLTHRGKTEACGFPFHALDTYLPKLVRAGKRVAIVDALEDPKNATGKVKRGVTEIVKPKETGKKKESKAQPKNVEMKLTPRHFWTVWFDGNTVRVRKTIFSDHYHIAGHAKGLSFEQIQCFCHNESGQNYPNKNNDYWLRTHVKKDKECYKAAVKRGEYSTYGDVIKKVEGRDWYFRDINDAERFAKKHLPEGGKYMEYDVSDENWRHMLDIISGRIKIK